MKFKHVLIVASVVAVLSVMVWAVKSLTADWLQPLGYDRTQELRIGRHSVTVQTESMSFTPSDNGPARLTITAGDVVTIVKSRFDCDLYSNVRPAYVSRRDIDQDGRRDLVIWKPDAFGGLEAQEYVSGETGRLLRLDVSLERGF